MQCACVTLAEKLRGRLNLLCTLFPGGHWIRANIHSGHREVVCHLNKIPQIAMWKRDRNPMMRHTNIDSQPDSYIYSQPATIASLWSQGLPGPTDQKRAYL